MATERLGNLGYLGLVKETTKGVALTPTDYVPLYDESLTTDPGLQDLKPAAGNKFATFLTIPGQRSHKGDVTILAEPNTLARFHDMLLTRSATTGSNPYTHTFGLSNTTNPNSYTVDISAGNIVKRFMGVEASKLSPNLNNNEIQAKISVSALGSFQGREIASQSGAGPYTITLKTDYDPSPTTGLVVGDLIRFYRLSTGATIDATVATVPTGTTFTTTTNPTGMTAGDFVHLRPATTSFNLLTPFQWAKTQFCFGATASAALSASQTRVEQDSSFELMHDFESDDGAQRSGSFDPAALVRTTGDVSLTVKKFFDVADDIINMNNLATTACVVRMYAGSTNQYEWRVTFNQLKTDNPLPKVKAGDINYSQIKYHTNYNTSDGQAFDVKLIDSLATI